jgi:EmrB/QacA subfamily drug resistance transporter
VSNASPLPSTHVHNSNRRQTTLRKFERRHRPNLPIERRDLSPLAYVYKAIVGIRDVPLLEGSPHSATKQCGRKPASIPKIAPNPAAAPQHPYPCMKSPCDEAVIRSSAAESPCSPQSGPWILAAAILGSSMAFIDGTVVNVALPVLQTTFKATVTDVQWVVESYGLFLGALILVGGSAGDLFGRRRIFVIGVTIFAFASAACGLAQNIHQLIYARAIQGTGAALLTPGSLAIISASFPEQQRGRAIGTWSGFTAMTMALGPVLGGWLIEHVSWRWIFYINPPLAAAVVVISLGHVPESHGPTAKRLDFLGALLVTLGLGGLVYGLVESPRLGWSDPSVIASLVLAIPCLAAFPLVEARATNPMVPLNLFRSRIFTAANLLTLFLYSALGIFFFVFPMNLIQVQHYSATAAGAAALPLILLMFLLSRWSGGLVTRYGPKLPLVVGPLIAAFGFVLFALPSVGGSYWTTFFPAFVVLGFGMAVSVAPLTTTVMTAVDRDHSGTASGINNAVARIAGLLAVAVFGIVMVNAFAAHLDHELNRLNISQAVREQAHSDRTKLATLELAANAAPNSSVAPTASAELKSTIANSFVFAFRIIALSCAALAIASSAVAALLIEGRR